MKALTVALLPRPGLPNAKMLGLVTGTSSRSTHPSGSAENDPPLSWSVPLWAPVGGSPGGLMNGHSTGAWSEVIRHVETGAFAGDHPRPGRRAPARARM